MAEPTDLSVEILKQIRDEIVLTRSDLGARIDVTNQRVDGVERALIDLAEQQRFVVRHLGALTSRDRRLEEHVEDLEARVQRLEADRESG